MGWILNIFGFPVTRRPTNTLILDPMNLLKRISTPFTSDEVFFKRYCQKKKNYFKRVSKSRTAKIETGGVASHS